MATLTVYSQQGAEVGSYEFDSAELAASVNQQLLHDAVVMYLANKRQGSHRTRTRAEVAGSTRKMYRQKGTGNARAGSRRSGVRRGGGHIFALRPRDFSYRLPKKALRLATRMALLSKIESGAVSVLDELSMSQPKTREMAGVLKALDCDGRSALIATNGLDVNVYKSARNIDRVEVLPAQELNAYALMRPQRIVITRAALDAFRGKAAAATDAAAG